MSWEPTVNCHEEVQLLGLDDLTQAVQVVEDVSNFCFCELGVRVVSVGAVVDVAICETWGCLHQERLGTHKSATAQLSSASVELLQDCTTAPWDEEWACGSGKTGDACSQVQKHRQSAQAGLAGGSSCWDWGIPAAQESCFCGELGLLLKWAEPMSL